MTVLYVAVGADVIVGRYIVAIGATVVVGRSVVVVLIVLGILIFLLCPKLV